MRRTIIYGLLSASVASIAIGGYLNFFYSFKFDETYKILPIWKVVSFYFIVTLILSILSLFIYSKWNKLGLFMLNGMVSILAMASLGIPIKYTNSEIDTTFLAIAAVPILFVLPLVWMTFQPIVFRDK
jgi:hypothetical protein